MNERVFPLHRRALLRKFFEWASFRGFGTLPGSRPGPFELSRLHSNGCYRSQDIIFPVKNSRPVLLAGNDAERRAALMARPPPPSAARRGNNNPPRRNESTKNLSQITSPVGETNSRDNEGFKYPRTLRPGTFSVANRHLCCLNYGRATATNSAKLENSKFHCSDIAPGVTNRLSVASISRQLRRSLTRHFSNEDTRILYS